MNRTQANKTYYRTSYIAMMSLLLVVSVCITATPITASTSTSGPAALKKAALIPKPARTTPVHVTTTVSGQVDMCLSCHNEKPDQAHGRDVLGCTICHKGNPLAGSAERAHRGLIINPGELAVADRTCGTTGCHPEEVKRTRKSLMATNRGIISTLRYYWGETDSYHEKITIDELNEKNIKTPAADYFRKLCATCHTGMTKGALPGFLAEKGGGCTACHSTPPQGADAAKGIFHAKITKNVPLHNCVRCHNRSGRIGLTYQGKYESEGYGTPYSEGELSGAQLGDGRYFRQLTPDVHFKAGMVCGDCHTQKEVMGDGKDHSHLQEQLEVRCDSCHAEKVHLEELVSVSQMPYNAWQQQMDQIEPPRLRIKKQDNRIVLEGMADRRLHRLAPPVKSKCMQPVHERLTCQACHSTWVPQCYGCHVQNMKGKKQLDKITGMDSWGSWKEFKSFMRFNAPVLGILEGAESSTRKSTGMSRNANHEQGEVVILVPG